MPDVSSPQDRPPTRRRPLLTRSSVALAILVLAVAAWAAFDWYDALPRDALAEATYVGRQSCIECHQTEAKLFHGSDHDRAMELATEETVLGDFDDARFTRLGVTTRMFRRDGKFYANAEGPDGDMHDYLVKWTFGVEPLQQYMTEFPDGRVQVLPASWDTRKKEWFAVTPPDVPDERIQPDDPLHWTGLAQNWNTMCAECHSTDLRKNYDLDTDSYHTTFNEIDVSCEACHGPGSVHVEIAESSSLFWDRRHGYGMTNRLKTGGQLRQIETCAPCHSRRSAIHPNYRAGDEYLDHYRPALLQAGLYHADGQILDEVYVYGSFLQSKMYHKGIQCTDCHNPHSLELKFDGNKLCAQCHQPGKYDGLGHHHHPPGEGSQCVNCHMPSRTYMNIDDRRDHSLRIPRPDISVQLGTPNACNDCHMKSEENAEWAAEQVRQWYGEKRPDDPHYAPAIAAGRTGDPEGERLLRDVVSRRDTPEIVRATAVELLAVYNTEKSAEVREKALSDDNAMVRTAATNSFIAGSAQSMLQRIQRQLKDSVRDVRLAAVSRLIGLVGQLQDRSLQATLREAAGEYRESQRMQLDRVEAHLNLARLEAGLGDSKEAIEQLRAAIRIAPYRTDPRTMLVELLVANDGDPEEIRRLRQEEAELLLRDQALLPDSSQLHYRRGMLLYLLDRPDETREELEEAARLGPDNYQNWLGLALICQKQERWKQALEALEQMERLRPGSPDVRNLYQEIKNSSGK